MAMENKENPGEGLVFSSDRRKSGCGTAPVIKQGMLFTAYATEPKGFAIDRTCLRIGAIPRITGYAEWRGPYCRGIPKVEVDYRWLVCDGPSCLRGHNYFRAYVFRKIFDWEINSFGEIEPELLRKMITAVRENRNIRLPHESAKLDFEHLKSMSPELLDGLLKICR